MSEDFLLKWNDHHTLFFAGAEKLYQDEEFTDVTLAAGSKFFKAHKLVLSICSPCFQSLFRRLGPEKHVIFLKDISSLHLELLFYSVLKRPRTTYLRHKLTLLKYNILGLSYFQGSLSHVEMLNAFSKILTTY